jgi:hypothetical protein
MFRYTTGEFKTNPPTHVNYEGFSRRFSDLSREQWDSLGYNEAIPLCRAPHTKYETQWIKGEDLIYREEIISQSVDEENRHKALAKAARSERNYHLSTTDWTQLTDTALDDGSMVIWQSYRQALRDIPQQSGFPASIEWPEMPEME